MIVGNSRLRRAVGFANGSLLSTTAGGGGTDPGGGSGTTFTYEKDETGSGSSSSAFSGKGNVVQPNRRLSITHMRAYMNDAVTGTFMLARVDNATGEIYEILGQVAGVSTTALAWTEVELPAPVTVHPDASYLLLFDRTGVVGGTSSTIRFINGWTVSESRNVTGWRNNDNETIVGAVNESPSAADWLIDWRGEYFDDAIPTIVGYDMVEIGTATADFTFTYPAGIAAGDGLLLILMDDDSTENEFNYTEPADYKQVAYFSNYSDSGVTIMRKAATGSESGSLVVPLASGDNRDKVGFLLVLRGASVADGIILDPTPRSSSSDTVTAISITTEVPNALVITAISFDGADGGPMTNINADFDILDQGAVGAGSVGVTGIVLTRELAVPGASGAASLSANVSDGHATITFAVAASGA